MISKQGSALLQRCSSAGEGHGAFRSTEICDHLLRPRVPEVAGGQTVDQQQVEATREKQILSPGKCRIANRR